VVLGYDEKLDRKVAIKLPRPDRRIDVQRSMREAQGLARLSHANVVQIYEVGMQGESLYLAMEYVEGQTLDAWLRETPRAVRDVVAVFGAAGRGLAAAHAAKLIHRDFKPHNVFVAGGRGGERIIKVFDFGLARSSEDAGPEPSDPAPTLDAGSDSGTMPSGPLESELTRAGAVVGTPGYMAPEQLRRKGLDARTDQFAFCVSLWQALYGELPFERRNLTSYALAVLQGTRRPPPKGNAVPSWLREIVERGLSIDPAQRWPSMDALLAALERDPTRRRRQLVAGLALVGVVAGGVGLDGWQREQLRAQTIESCEAEAGELAELWSPTRADRIGAALLASGAPDAADTWTRAQPLLDEHATRWAALRRGACTDTLVERRRSDAWLDHARACFEERRQSLAALLDVLESATPEMVPFTLTSIHALDSLDACVADDVESRQSLDDAATREQTRALRARLARLESLEQTGEYASALAEAKPLLVDAEALGGPLVPEVRVALGELALRSGEFELAETTLERALFDAGATGLDAIALRAATALTLWDVQVNSEVEAALRWNAIGTMFVARGGLSGTQLEIALLQSRAKVWMVGARYDEAIATLEQVITMLEQRFGSEHVALASAHYALAHALYSSNALERANAAAHRALAIFERQLGPEHPNVAMTLNLLGALYYAGADHDAAIGVFERSLAISERRLGPDHPRLASPLGNLATMYYEKGEAERGLPYNARALAIDLASYGPESTQVASSLHTRGLLRATLGRDEEALIDFREALRIDASHFEPTHPSLAPHLLMIGEVELRRGRLGEAQAVLEQALAIQEPLGPSPMLDDIRFVLGKALVSAGERERGRALVELARAGFVAMEQARNVEQVDTWLAAQPSEASDR
jgi:tetratricopeptide (TPR) repeat protein